MSAQSSTVRVSAKTKRQLRALANQTKLTLGAILERAVEQYRRRIFVQRANASYAALRKDKRAWRHQTAERRAWDETLSDGLDEI